MTQVRHLFLVLFFATIASGCSSLAYYFQQSIPGHLNIMWKTQEIEEAILETDDEVLKQRLTKIKDIREYASNEIKLPDNGSYRAYANIERDYVTWNVTAAPELSIEPRKWCYFVIGCASYRGYFNERDAENYAKVVRDEGYDVYISRAIAYSTLGFFDDPVLNTMMRYSDAYLAGFIFHELSHHVLYIKNDTEFNEAFATAVEQISTMKWLMDQGQDIQIYLENIRREISFRYLLIETRDKLKETFEQAIDDKDKRDQKAAIYAELRDKYEVLRKQWQNGKNYDHWFEQPLNNARMTSVLTYIDLIPAFYQLYLAANMEWDVFFEETKTLSEKEKPLRALEVNRLAENGVTLLDIHEILAKTKHNASD